MAWDLIIRGGTVVTRAIVGIRDIAVEGGSIVEVGEGLVGSGREEIDATGLHVFPGVIDAHVHFNEPGRTDWEGFETGSAALAAGGGTCFFDMPLNASPPTLDGESFDLKLAAATANSRTDFALWGGLTPSNLDKMEELAERGVIGFKAFMSNSGIGDFGRADDDTLFRGMRIAARLDLPVAVHAEDENITARLTAEATAAGRTTYRDYLSSRPVAAEIAAIERAVAIAEQAGCSLHIVHISSSQGVRAAGLYGAASRFVTRETCPHYLCFTEDDLMATGATLKCAPPLRDQSTVHQLRAALQTGSITLIGSDHSPAPAAMKTSADAFQVWGGIAGVQSTLPALLSLEPEVNLRLIVQLIARNVARRFNILGKGQVDANFDADISLVDLNASYQLTRDMLLDRHKLSPYVGRTFRGLVKRTIVRGHTVFRDGKSVGEFRGALVRPNRSSNTGDENA